MVIKEEDKEAYIKLFTEIVEKKDFNFLRGPKIHDEKYKRGDEELEDSFIQFSIEVPWEKDKTISFRVEKELDCEYKIYITNTLNEILNKIKYGENNETR